MAYALHLHGITAYRVLLQTGRIALECALAERRQFGVLPDYPLDQFTQRQENAIPVVIVGLEPVAGNGTGDICVCGWVQATTIYLVLIATNRIVPRLPYRDAFRLQIVPARVHLVEAPLQHDRILLRGERAQQLTASAVQAVVYDSV